jgi:hypothetical protein
MEPDFEEELTLQTAIKTQGLVADCADNGARIADRTSGLNRLKPISARSTSKQRNRT